jgi:hypothetical protein
MAKRRSMSRKASRKLFTNTAKGTNRRNVVPGVQRGGIRM